MSGLRYWTDGLIVAAIRGWQERHGQPPRKLEWRNAAPDHPSSRTVIERFGTWNTAITAAGFTPRRRFAT